MSGFVRGFSSMIGPILGGIAIAAVGYTAVFAFNTFSFLISALFECFLEIPEHQNKQIEHAGIMRNAIDGLRYIFRIRKLIIILIMVAIIHFFVGSIEVLMPVFSSQLAGSGAKNLGYIQTFFGLGTVLAALIISFYNINCKEVSLLFGGVFAFGSVCLLIAYLSISGIKAVMLYLGPFLLLGSFIIVAATCFRTILQKNVENEMAGRVFGAVGTIGDISIPIAMLIYGFLLKLFACSWLLAVSGFILILLSSLFYRSYRRIDAPGQRHLVIDPEFHE